MKAAVIGVSALVVVALAVGGYFAFRPDSNDSTSGQTDYAAQLDSLCLDSRKQTEALGKPSDIPISTFYPGTVRIGRAFLKDARALTPPPDQAAAAKTFLQQRGLYYDGLEYALPVPDDSEQRRRVPADRRRGDREPRQGRDRGEGSRRTGMRLATVRVELRRGRRATATFVSNR